MHTYLPSKSCPMVVGVHWKNNLDSVNLGVTHSTNFIPSSSAVVTYTNMGRNDQQLYCHNIYIILSYSFSHSPSFLPLFKYVALYYYLLVFQGNEGLPQLSQGLWHT